MLATRSHQKSPEIPQWTRRRWAPGAGAAMGLGPRYATAFAHGDGPLQHQGVGIRWVVTDSVVAVVARSGGRRQSTASHTGTRLEVASPRQSFEWRFSACQLTANVRGSWHPMHA